MIRADHPGRIEFVALMAMLTATVAFSIDAMLPALPEIGQSLTPDDINRAQLVVTSFLLGLGTGTFVAGPLSDSCGRKTVILAGAVVYVASAVFAMTSDTLWMLVAARTCQGFGAAGARIVALAIIRDMYSGREMARLVSFVMMVFTLIPAIAPLVGSGIIALAGWHGIFVSFICFALVSSLWLVLRLPEPLPRERRKHFDPQTLARAAKEVLSLHMVRISVLVQALCFATLFSSISSIQQVIGDSFGRADQFPLWFCLIALVAGTGSMLNATLVVRLGMRRLIQTALAAQIGLSLLAWALLSLDLPADLRFGIYIAWQTSVFFQASMTLGNLTALAMEPLGHIAGTAASVINGLATVGSVLLAIPVGLSFDGTPMPLVIGVFTCMVAGRLLMTRLPR